MIILILPDRIPGRNPGKSAGGGNPLLPQNYIVWFINHAMQSRDSRGVSTKKRGWGLGLSLAKRIVENYHSGKIYIKGSEMGKGTTFRIILNKGKK